MVYKRYEYWGPKGKTWTDWFPWNSTLRDKWQFKNRLLNDYKDEEE